jgi:hypothetical protein
MARRSRALLKNLDTVIGPTDASPRLAVFMRGVTIGAFVGAAIAGSAIWERAHRRRADRSEAPVEPDSP